MFLCVLVRMAFKEDSSEKRKKALQCICNGSFLLLQSYTAVTAFVTAKKPLNYKAFSAYCYNVTYFSYKLLKIKALRGRIRLSAFARPYMRTLFKKFSELCNGSRQVCFFLNPNNTQQSGSKVKRGFFHIYTYCCRGRRYYERRSSNQLPLFD